MAHIARCACERRRIRWQTVFWLIVAGLAATFPEQIADWILGA